MGLIGWLHMGFVAGTMLGELTIHRRGGALHVVYVSLSPRNARQ